MTAKQLLEYAESLQGKTPEELAEERTHIEEEKSSCCVLMERGWRSGDDKHNRRYSKMYEELCLKEQMLKIINDQLFVLLLKAAENM